MKADVTAENKPDYPRKVRIAVEVNTRERADVYEDQGGVQVFIVLLHEVAVVLVGLSLKLVVELDAGAASRSKEIRKERWQCLEHCILQAGNESSALVKD